MTRCDIVEQPGIGRERVADAIINRHAIIVARAIPAIEPPAQDQLERIRKIDSRRREIAPLLGGEVHLMAARTPCRFSITAIPGQEIARRGDIAAGIAEKVHILLGIACPDHQFMVAPKQRIAAIQPDADVELVAARVKAAGRGRHAKTRILVRLSRQEQQSHIAAILRIIAINAQVPPLAQLLGRVGKIGRIFGWPCRPVRADAL